MDKYEIIRKIEKFAPPELAESWDCSGWAVETSATDIKKVMICLTVTEDVVRQAKENCCDMIISHHPLFFVPFSFIPSPPGERVPKVGEGLIDIYSAHTNMDKTNGGTTDELINTIFPNTEIMNQVQDDNFSSEGFVRYINVDININDFLAKLAKISPNLRYVNNKGIKNLHKIGFCAGSGMEFIKEAQLAGADGFVSGDLKFHAALDSEIAVFDIGHFESEILILKVFSEVIGDGVEKIFAEEKSPFQNIDN